MKTPLPARRLEPIDGEWAMTLLEAACADHPLLAYCCQGPDALAQRSWLLGQLLCFGFRYGRVYANAEASAVAVWVAPSHPATALHRLLRSGLLPDALWHLDWASFRRLRHFLVASAWLRRRGRATASHHLLALAVHPAARGQGQGQRLLRATLAALRATHTPCYLNAQQPAELLFFQRLGFRLLGQYQAGPEAEAPVSWGLLRAPG